MVDELANDDGELSKRYFDGKWKGVRREVGDERKGKKGILGIKWKVWMNVDLNLARFIPKVCSFFSS